VVADAAAAAVARAADMARGDLTRHIMGKLGGLQSKALPSR
jgi:hypothetical protein